MKGRAMATLNGSKPGYLTREESDALCYFDLDVTGFGKVRFRKLGRPEWESFWPLLPPAADEWPKPPALGPDATEVEKTSRDETITARRLAEFNWLRTQDDEDQIRYQARRNDIAFRTIAACLIAPTYTMAQARALGDHADVLYLAIMTKSQLYKEPEAAPSTPAAQPAEATADAA